MRVANAILTGFMLLACLFGCGKKSALVGKVIDGKGQSMPGVRVVAKKVHRSIGYGQLEVITGSDGVFKFGKLYPASEYELIPYLGTNIKSRILKTESAPGGLTKVLPQPLPILFVPSKAGLLVHDTSTGLFWVRDAANGGKMNWNAAMSKAKQFKYAGFSDWRLPTRDELRSLAAYGGEKPAEGLNNDVFINVQAGCYWSSTNDGNNLYAWAVNMKDGKKVNDSKTANGYYVWLVRSGK